MIVKLLAENRDGHSLRFGGWTNFGAHVLLRVLRLHFPSPSVVTYLEEEMPAVLIWDCIPFKGNITGDLKCLVLFGFQVYNSIIHMGRDK